MWATRLWWLLRYFGHDDTSVLDGGLAAWAAGDGPVEPGESTYPPASFTARPRPELLASLADVREITENGSACLVNALSPQVFRGQGPSSYSRPGRIPGSVNVPWNGLVDPATNRFRPPAELAAALNGGGVRADQPVIAYCGGGISATVDPQVSSGREADLLRVSYPRPCCGACWSLSCGLAWLSCAGLVAQLARRLSASCEGEPGSVV
jgi:thiosulfate/3-mercaptopyruvate sulfurtransferase